MKKQSILCLLALLFLSAVPEKSDSSVLPFGLNKVSYRLFEWKILETEHFYIYFYPEEERFAKECAFVAEDVYEKATKDLGVMLPEKVPLFLYRNSIEFQQTNIISDYIGDGTGGFTEALKNRIAAPIVSSKRRFHEVLKHEFVHRIQFEVLYGGFGKPYKLLKSVFVPLWFMEGMAEVIAEDEDPAYTEMLVRDAVISERLRKIDDLNSFNHIEGREIVLMYKLSQKIFEYIEKNYGKEKIGGLLKEYLKPQITVSLVFENILGIGMEDFNKKWMFALREQYWNEIYGRKNADDYGKPVTYSDKNEISLNTSPVWSLKSDKIAYISDSSNYTDIYIIDLKTFEKRNLLGNSFEYIVRSGNGISWSFDGKKIAFCALREGKYELFTVNAENGEIRKIKTDFEYVKSPSFSKNGNLIFAGVKDSLSDIYYLTQSGEIVRMTNDDYDDDYPVFSPDESKIAYISERKGKKHLFIIHLDENGKTIQLTGGNHNDIALDWHPDSSKIIFASDRHDFKYNLFEIDLGTKELSCLTNIKIGLFSPKYSYDGKKVLFSSFENGCQNIYIMDLAVLNPAEVKKYPADRIEENAENSGNNGEEDKKLDEIKKIKMSKFLIYNYGFKPDLDLIYFIFGYDSASGFLGGAYLSGSDMLGDHYFEFYGDYIKDFHHGYQFTYYFLPWKVDLGLSLFRWRDYYTTLDSSGAAATKYWLDDLGVALLARYPLDRFHRIDFAFATKLRTSEGIFGNVDPYNKQINSVSLAFVRDKRLFNIDEAIAGISDNFTVEYSQKWFGSDINLASLFTEHHFYAGIARETNLAFRLFYGASFDSDKSVFLLGGSNTLRGFGFGSYMGENIAYFNTEFRFPLITDINFNLWPFNWLFIKKLKAAVFVDIGSVWDREFNFSNIKNGAGVGLRLHTYLMQSLPMIIRFDIGKRTDSSEKEVYYFSLGHAF